MTDYSSTPDGESCAVDGFSSRVFMASSSESCTRKGQCDQDEDDSQDVKAVSTFVAEAGFSTNSVSSMNIASASRPWFPTADAAKNHSNL